ncbi:MAG TPA: antibiotic biosynthesis monooxygenase family protein [Holophagaceae bacterium]|nr:antibiotic biosynthesis monooxygenase family protein [Holophagaceae bacterium]
MDGKNLANYKERAAFVLLTALTGKEEELLQILEVLAKEVQEMSGCLHSTLTQTLQEGRTFAWCLVWKDAPSLAKFMSSEVFRILLGAAGTLCAPVHFRFIADETPESSELTNRIRNLAASDSIGGAAPSGARRE